MHATGSPPHTLQSVSNPIKILCVDDHDFIAGGLAARMASEPDLNYVGRLESAAHLSDAIQRLRPDVVLLDLEMPGPPPLEAMTDALRNHPNVAVIVLSGHVRDASIRGALDGGASGYFSKSDATKLIFDGIRRVAEGGTAFGSDVAERLESQAGTTRVETRFDTLSPREVEVLRLVGRGMSRADIARALCRSHKTIDAHHTAIMRKLDIHDRAELTRYAIREGLVEP